MNYWEELAQQKEWNKDITSPFWLKKKLLSSAYLAEKDGFISRIWSSKIRRYLEREIR